jgi:NAD(P)-dependent dehydrogenase (short-subunit alcohol dehydrogenase family)
MTDAPFAARVVVVTGASQGLGRAIAIAFGRAGAHVVLAARNVERLHSVAAEIESDGGAAMAVPTDLRDTASVQNLARAVHDELGDVDALVNNSGIAGPTAVLWEQSVEDFEDALRVNVTGVFLCCREFLPRMVERRRGNVIIIGSMTGKRPLYGRTPYAASKTALIGLTRTLATEVGPAGIRVNLVSPGPVNGDRLEKVIELQASAKGISIDESRAALARASPLGQFIDDSEVADAVLFLASPRASKITGEDLNVSAGAVMYS